MKFSAIKILTFSIFSLVLIGQILPAQAAPKAEKKAEKKADKSSYYELKEFNQLPNSAKSAIITSAFCISGVGVIFGTGKSIKHEREEFLKTEKMNKLEASN